MAPGTNTIDTVIEGFEPSDLLERNKVLSILNIREVETYQVCKMPHFDNQGQIHLKYNNGTPEWVLIKKDELDKTLEGKKLKYTLCDECKSHIQDH